MSRGEPSTLIDGGGLVSDGVGGGGTILVDVSGIEEIEDRSADAGAEGCENGLPGPLGASPNV